MRALIVAVIMALFTLTACGSPPGDDVAAPPTETRAAEPTAPPSRTPAASRTPAPTATATPEATPTPVPLTPADIFDSLSPAVVRIESGSRFGTGVLVEGNYVLSNAHVV